MTLHHPSDEEALDTLDALIFNGCPNIEEVNYLQDTIGRWSRRLSEHAAFLVGAPPVESFVDDPIQPITPQQAREQRIKSGIPPFVIDTINQMLVIRMRDNPRIMILQKDIVAAIQARPEYAAAGRPHIADMGWLDFESLFRKAGWSVDYDRPAYNESYEAFFVFTLPR